MVLHVTKYDIHPDKVEAYLKWTEGAIKRTLSVVCQAWHNDLGVQVPYGPR